MLFQLFYNEQYTFREVLVYQFYHVYLVKVILQSHGMQNKSYSKKHTLSIAKLSGNLIALKFSMFIDFMVDKLLNFLL